MLESADPDLLRGALTISRRLEEQGYQAYFAGGAVRDFLLGRELADIDIATSAAPDVVEKLFPQTIDVGKQFGVIVVVIDENNYEVATFRSDSGYEDGRHPSKVKFSDARQDALRRDFTINSLFLNPLTGEVIDYNDGKDDLASRLIRTVGRPEQTLEEDKLRLLRAVRFACQLGFEIEADTYLQLDRFADQLGRISWERIRDEVLKVLTGPDPGRGLKLMFDTGILDTILPEVAAMDGVLQPPQFHPEGDVLEHTRLLFSRSRCPSETLALAILLHDVGKPPTFRVKERIRFDGHAELGAKMAETICRRLRLSNDTVDGVVDLVKDHLRFIHVKEMRESTLKRFLRRENIGDHLELHRLDCLASHGDLSNYEFCCEKLLELGQETLRPARLISGRDLIELGLEPGPLFSEILDTVEDRQLEGSLVSKDQALDWVETHYVGQR